MTSEIPNEQEAARAARTESAFREVNERIEEISTGFATAADPVAVVCECARVECVRPLELSSAEYDVVREHPSRFIVAPYHVDERVERVVRMGEGYVVVEKFAEDVARARDPRSD